MIKHLIYPLDLYGFSTYLQQDSVFYIGTVHILQKSSSYCVVLLTKQRNQQEDIIKEGQDYIAPQSRTYKYIYVLLMNERWGFLNTLV